jgi:ketosteroid isomerase-like protein
VVLSLTVLSGAKPSNKASTPTKELTDAERISGLLAEMETIDLASLPALPVERFSLPPSGVDVMRVRLDESYDVAGVGKDTVELTGWIAVKHSNTRPVEGQTEVKWGTAITDTEFVGMDLRGESKIFGPIRVRLNQNQRTIGHVGAISLPFPIGSTINVAYKTQAGTPSNETRVTSTERMGHRQRGGKQFRGESRSVEQVIMGVLEGVSNKDPKTMLRYYDQTPGNLFFGMTIDGPKRTSAEDHINTMSQQFAGIRSIKARPNDDLEIKVSGNLATAALTGVNNVVDTEGRQLKGLWRWSVVLAKKGRNWLITHDHIDFYVDANAPKELRTLEADCASAARSADAAAARASCKCVASISVDVDMPKLDLHMTTATPVLWYSKVDTIPPVGFTASVLLTPTPMISGGREVATLQHGTVKFREVVRHVRLTEFE